VFSSGWFSSWFGSGSVLRSALISMVIVGIAAVLMIAFGPNLAIGTMHIQVLNDTVRVVTETATEA